MIGSETWHLGKQGRVLFAEIDGVRRFTARKRGFFSGTWDISGTSNPGVEIRRAGVFSRTYRIFTQGAPLAEVRNRSFWTSQPSAEFPDRTPLPEAVFLLWVAFILKRRDAAASSGGSGG